MYNNCLGDDGDGSDGDEIDDNDDVRDIVVSTIDHRYQNLRLVVPLDRLGPLQPLLLDLLFSITQPNFFYQQIIVFTHGFYTA